MMVTVEEAKTRWCPFARTGINGSSGAVAVNRSVEPVDRRTDGPYSVYDETRCIGTACLAWRWGAPESEVIETPTDKPPAGEGWKKSSKLMPQHGGEAVWERRRPNRRGFCGLSGPSRSD